METGFLQDRQPKTFTGIGGAKQWKEVDYAADHIRMRLASGAINDVADLNSAVKAESIEHRLNKRELRIKLRDMLLATYVTPKQRSDIDSPAFSAAISPS